jgi:hypothetical protein
MQLRPYWKLARETPARLMVLIGWQASSSLLRGVPTIVVAGYIPSVAKAPT